jgi:catechol 2,3-dioxygenase-like lactoylglutathione lyase family enzyme
MKIKGLTHVRLFAWPEDWAACCLFYGEILGLKPELTDERTGVAMFKLGDVHLLIERADERNDETRALVGRLSGISLRVDSSAQAAERLTELNIPIPTTPQRQHWGDTLLHLKDPAGNVITLIEFGKGSDA